MTPEEIKAIEERQQERMKIFESQVGCPDTESLYLDDIAALIAGYKERDAEAKRLKEEAEDKRLDDLEEGNKRDFMKDQDYD